MIGSKMVQVKGMVPKGMGPSLETPTGRAVGQKRYWIPFSKKIQFWDQKGEYVMNKEYAKEKKGIYLNSGLWNQVDQLLEFSNARSRNEFVSMAIKFYVGYLTSMQIENYMLSTISSVMHSTVKDSENRLARALFKLAVEISKLSHVIAYSHDIEEELLNKLQVKCVEEVKRINGSIKFEDAYSYQRK